MLFIQGVKVLAEFLEGMLREVDKSFFAMGFEPGSLEEGATVGLGWRGGELLVEVDGGEFVGGGDVRLVHEK